LDSFNLAFKSLKGKDKKAEEVQEVDPKKPQDKSKKPDAKVEQVVVEEVFTIENRPTL